MRPARGFTLVSAVFLVVILSAIAAYALSVATLQQHASALDVAGSRALFAARAGTEWGAYQALRLDACAASATLDFSGTPLAPLSVSVRCARRTADEAGTTRKFDSIVALACNEPPCPNAAAGANYVERQLTVVVEH
ncbi:MAG: agglutinin biogenesis protein MshP [Betaproteobacteria bacterium]|nr:agglutinin biogenesis protein MshP [Betaproteobacteria bacterium]